MAWTAGDPGVVAWMNNIDSAWTAYTPTLTGFPATINHARYKQVGKTVIMQARFTLTGAATAPMSVSLPVAAGAHHAPSLTSPEVVGSVAVAQVSNAWFQGVAALTSTSAVMFFAVQGGGQFAAAAPFTWASGHIFSFTATYEAA